MGCVCVCVMCVQFAPYESQTLGLLANFQSMPVDRLRSVLELTMISPK